MVLGFPQMKRRLCLGAALSLLTLNLSYAQSHVEPIPTERGSATHAHPRDRAEGLITLDALVTDQEGTAAAGLNAANFRLLENGREQKILSFDPLNGVALRSEPAVKIILLLDKFQVPTDIARDEQLAAEAFLRKEGGRLGRPISVFELTESGLWTVAHPSSDGASLANEIDHNQLVMVRGTALSFQGAGQFTHPSEFGLRALGQIATDERRRSGRKLLLWVGPGRGIGTNAVGDVKPDSKLFGTVSWFSDLLREAHLALYSFSVGPKDPAADDYKEYLAGVSSPKKASLMNLTRNVLAIQSGGLVIDSGPDLEEKLERCMLDAGPFYRISFDPFAAEHTYEYHDLQLEVSEPGLTVRTNTGYYDQPYYSTNPIPAPRLISIADLQKILELDESDAEKAKQLSGVELTEKLSQRRLASLFQIAHGKKTRQELIILFDTSCFLAPPPDERVAAAPPDAGEQKRMLARTSEYLNTTIHKLPDLFAKRTTVRYQESPMDLEGGSAYQPLHQTDSLATAIHYRNGAEVTDQKSHKVKPGDPELLTYGEFGPVLEGVLEDFGKSEQLQWSRWEDDGGRIAVFRYSVPSEESDHHVMACCLPDGDGRLVFQRYPGYHGEISINPETGAILRLTFQSDLKSTTPLSRSDIMIQYGPVDMGGKTYICPLKSVSIMRIRSVRILTDWDEWFRIYGPYATMLNDISFGVYHVFRSNSRILPTFTPDGK